MRVETARRVVPDLGAAGTALAVGVVVAGAIALIVPAAFPADDGFFYLQIARNWWDNGEVSFHGFDDTNGFHPLWWFVLTAVAPLAGAEGDWFVRLAFVVGWCALAAGLWIARRWFTEHTPAFVAMAGVLAVAFVAKGALYLFEIWFAAAAILWILVELTTDDDDPERSDIRLGWAMAFMVVSRLDLVVVTPVFALVALYRRGIDTGRLARLASPGLLLVGAYCAWSQAVFGDPLPVSGQIKSSFPDPHWSLNTLGVFGRGALFLTIAVAVHTAVRRDGSATRRALVILVGANAVYITWIALFSASAEWYYSLAYVMAAVWIGWVVQTHGQAVGTGVIVACAVLVPTLAAARAWTTFSITAGLLVEGDLRFVDTQPRRQLATDLAALLPPGTPVAMYDTPGIVAYYTDLRVVPVDGLVNGPDYSEELVAEGGLPWFCSRGIEYLVVPFPGSPEEPVYFELHFAIGAVPGGGWDAAFGVPETSGGTPPFHLDAEDLLWEGENPVPQSADTHPRLGLWALPCT